MRVQKEETGVVYKSQCQGTGVAYPSFKRWNVRLEHGEPILSPPGPKKIGLMDLAALDAEIDGLGHGRRRTRGTCALYERHRTEISRRHLHARVVCARRQRNRERKEGHAYFFPGKFSADRLSGDVPGRGVTVQV